MGSVEQKNEIDEIAIRIVEDFHAKKDAGVRPDDYFESEAFFSARNELMEKMMEYDDIAADDSDSWELMLKYIIRSIPSFKIKKTESQRNSFVHYLNSFFVENHKNMVVARKQGKDISNFVKEKKKEKSDIKQMTRIISFCESVGIDLENPSEEELDLLVDKFYSGKKENPINEKREKISDLLKTAVCFRQIDNPVMLNPNMLLRSSGSSGALLSGNIKQDISLIQNIIYLIRKTIKEKGKNSPEKTHSRVRCLYTNEIAGRIRGYTDATEKQEYEKELPDDEIKEIRAKYMSDVYEPISEELFTKLFVNEYLSFVLDEPDPDTIYRICTNDFNEDDDGKRSFTQICIAKFYKVSEQTVSNNYKKLFDEANRKLKKMYGARVDE